MASVMEGGNTLLLVSASDLKDFALYLLEYTRKQVADNETEKLLSREEVCDQLAVTKPTLWRWAKRGYLVPVKVGNRPLYRQSDILKLTTKED